MVKIENVGEFLQTLRKAKGLTQSELADMLSVSNKTVSKWESGVGLPEITTLVILADIYDVTVDDILRGSKRATRDPEKEYNLLNYVVSKSKHKYINILIVGFGLWLLSNIVIIVLGEITINSTLSMGVGIFVVFIGLFLQMLNISNIKQQVKEVEINEKHRIYRFVFNTSYILYYLFLATFMFALTYNVGINSKLKFDYVIYRFIFSYAILGILAIIIYFFVRLFKLNIFTKIKLSNIILSLILLLVLLVPLVVTNITNPYDLAIKTDHSSLNYSIYYKYQNEYYELKYLYLESKGKVEPNFLFNNKTQKYETSYTFNDGYQLIINQERFSFLEGLGYEEYEITDDTAIGFGFNIEKSELKNRLYVDIIMPLIGIYGIGYVLFIIIKKRKRLA